MKPTKLIRIFCCTVFLCVAWGCQPSPDTRSEDPPAVEATVSDDLVTHFATADKLDGQEDQVVHRCYACALSMDGNSQIAAKGNGYTFHFCSDHCRTQFVENPDQIVSQAMDMLESAQ